MPRFSFRISQTEEILWRFDHPGINEEVVLGDRGVFRVLKRVANPSDPTVDAEYTVELVRASTHEDLSGQLERGVDKLPPAAG